LSIVSASSATTFTQFMHECRLERERKNLPGIHSFREFFESNPPSENYKYGKHTNKLIDEMQATTEAIEAGECRYIVICIPPRHGKSDVASRRYGAWHLIRNPDHEIILASYNYSLASEMSYDLRRCVKEIGSEYRMTIETDRNTVGAWRIAGRKGSVFAAGLGGTITGRGGHIIIIDDYCKNREQAESLVMRDKVWESFQSDLMTRRAPIHAVVIVANRWHEDDLVGRCLNASNPSHETYDPDFPVFEQIIFPAQDEKTGKYLFPERFSEKYYRTTKSFMGSHAWNAQGLQKPVPRGGNMLMADNVQFIPSSSLPSNLRWRRGWDVASTSKEVVKNDPDRTAGTLAAYDKKSNRLYIKDVKFGNWSTLKRDKRIGKTAEEDGRGVQIFIEAVGGYVDTYNRFKASLRGKSIVHKVSPVTDKVSRASHLDPLFEDGRVYIVTENGQKPAWFDTWSSEFLAFPSGAHDDMVDSLVVAIYNDLMDKGFSIST